MRKGNWILAVVLILGVLLSGIAGYLVWHSAHTSYGEARMLGDFGGR